MLIAWLPVLAVVVGLLMWVLATQPIVKDAGRIVFACGVFVSLLGLSHRTVELLR